MTNPQEVLIEEATVLASQLRFSSARTIEALIAEIQRLDRHLERLGDDQQLSPHGDCHGDSALWCANEVIARVAYARANRYEDEK